MNTPAERLKEIETKLTELEALFEGLDGVTNMGRPEIQYRLEEVQFRLSRLDDDVGDRITPE